MPYTPEVDDYVRWNKEKHSVEGWVYFKDQEYITIEIGVKCKDPDNITDCPIHQKTCLLYTSPSPRDRQKSRMPSSA